MLPSTIIMFYSSIMRNVGREWAGTKMKYKRVFLNKYEGGLLWNVSALALRRFYYTVHLQRFTVLSPQG